MSLWAWAEKQLLTKYVIALLWLLLQVQDPIFTIRSGNTRNREGGNKKVANIQANNHKFIQILFYTNMNEFL